MKNSKNNLIKTKKMIQFALCRLLFISFLFIIYFLPSIGIMHAQVTAINTQGATLDTVIQTQCGTSFIYLDVISNGVIWLDRNLGASQVATSKADYLAYGSLFQWGRLADGHECINWFSSTAGIPVQGTTSILSSTDIPLNSLFIITSTYPDDWLNPQNDNLWQGITGINNPCPAGYRVPTIAEWEQQLWSDYPTNSVIRYSNADDWFASPLKLTVPGFRYSDDGTLFDAGISGNYWSSTIDGDWSSYLILNSTLSYITEHYRSRGYSVRCIKDISTGENENNSEMNFTVFPNPNNGIYTAEIGESYYEEKIMDVEIINSVGQVIFCEELEKTNGKFIKRIDISNYAKGIYLIKIIRNSDDNLMKKIIVQ